MKTITRFTLNFIAMLIVIGSRVYAAPNCPADATEPAVAMGSAIWVIDDAGQPVRRLSLGDTVSPCTRLGVSGTLSYNPIGASFGRGAGYFGGTITAATVRPVSATAFTPFFANLTPAPGIPLIGPTTDPGSCPGAVSSLTTAIAPYGLPSAQDKLNGRIQFHITYSGGTACLSPGTFRVGVAQDLGVTISSFCCVLNCAAICHPCQPAPFDWWTNLFGPSGWTGDFPNGSKRDIAFYGARIDGHHGIYGGPQLGPFLKIADLYTAIPNGAGNFTSFSTNPSISETNVVFFAQGASGQEGIYAMIGGVLERTADKNTKIVGGGIQLTAFNPGNSITTPSPMISGTNVVFFGMGQSGQQGIYTKIGGNAVTIVNTNTAIPGGTNLFTGFSTSPMIRAGTNVAFIGSGTGGQQGIYAASLSGGGLQKVVDTGTNTLIPGGVGNFTGFQDFVLSPDEVGSSGLTLAFVGLGQAGQQGVYAVSNGFGGFVRIADRQTLIPDGSGTFTSFGAVSMSGSDIAFLANGNNGQQGIYARVHGNLVKVLDLHDTVDGYTITSLDFSRQGLSERSVVYKATLTDGTQTWQALQSYDLPAGTSIIVTNNNDSGAGSLRAAIAAAISEDKIVFASNVVGNITLTSGELAINKSLSIIGPTTSGLTVSGNNSNRVFHLTAGTNSISNLTIANGNTSGPGAGVFCEAGTLVLDNCTFSGNVSANSGGGVANNGAVFAYNCTFSRNQSANGGGIYTFAGPVTLRNCTVVSNTVVGATGAGGGVFNYSPAAGTSNNISGTLIAGNSAANHDDVIGVFTSGGYSLIGKIDYSTPASGGAAGVNTRGLTNGVNQDLVGGANTPINPLIGPLQNNGGPTFTHALRSDSPAIDKGIFNGLSADQRGAPRLFDFASATNAVGGDGGDIGAFELGRPQLSVQKAGANTVLVSWPSYYGDFALQQNTGGITSVSWGNVAAIPGDDGTNKTVVVNPATGNRFYRLKQ